MPSLEPHLQLDSESIPSTKPVAEPLHREIEPAILYFGTPVVLITTLNEDGSTNVAPISSAWWLGWSCMIGIDGSSKTTENLKRTGECVLNLPSDNMAEKVDSIALYTGSQRVPLHKKALGYRYSDDKLKLGGFTLEPSTTVAVSRLKECQIHLEAKVAKIHDFGGADPKMGVPAAAIELTVEKIHAVDAIMKEGEKDRVDPNLWRPLLMSFREFFGLGNQPARSKLAKGPEQQYAPWKEKGLKGLALNAALKVAYTPLRRKHKQME